MNVEAEVSGALTLAGKTAQKLVFESNELVGSFPATLDRLESGALNREQAMVIVEQAQTLPEHAQPGFEQELLAEAPGLPRPKLAGKAQRLRERMHPESAARRKEKAACDRRAYLQPAEDGMAWLGELAGPLGEVNPGDLSYHEATRALVSAGQLIAWAEGLKARLVIRLCDTAAGTVPQADPVGPNRNEEGLARMNVEAEVSGALTLAGKTAQKLVFESNELVGSFPSTLDRLESGTLNREQAMVIVNQAQTLPEDAQSEFEQELLSEAPGLPRPKLAGKAQRLRERMHPESAARRKEKAAC
ncbi:DUF222 domain-containing protein, partial [Arthrobacter sp. H14]|uniref:DUF222 domain-containing protein n=1 Tax=Arthrobacter sp. H14 TaxID=1312959 RepID=UPI00055A3090